MYIVNKTWGREEWIVNCPEYCGKYLKIRKGYKGSQHYHKKKKETFYCISGRVALYIGDKVYNCKEPVTVEPGIPHQFEGITNAMILEISTEHTDEDVYRMAEAISS